MLRFESFLLFALVGCSARTGLEVDGDTGAGGATSVTSTTTSSDVGGGPPSSCDGLVVVDPIVALSTPAPAARAPEIGVLPEGDAWVTLVESPPGVPGTLRVGRTNAFTEWPPNFVAMVELDPAVLDYVAGPGAGVPVALIRHASDAFLATSLFPTLEGIPFDTSGVPLFAVGISGRFLAASTLPTAGYSILEMESYQPRSLPQSEGPVLCTPQAILAAAVPVPDGFLVAYGSRNADDLCPPFDDKPPPSVVTTVHYRSTPDPGSFLTYEETDHAVFDDTVAHLALAQAPFGAWEVFQAAGDNARQPPAILAQRLGPNGVSLEPSGPVRVSPDGVTTPFIAVAPLGDALVVAWIDSFDPTAPTIIVQLVRADMTLGPSTSIPTNEVWQTGRLRIVASPNQRSLLFAWEGGIDVPAVGLARVDCVTGL